MKSLEQIQKEADNNWEEQHSQDQDPTMWDECDCCADDHWAERMFQLDTAMCDNCEMREYRQYKDAELSEYLGSFYQIQVEAKDYMCPACGNMGQEGTYCDYCGRKVCDPPMIEWVNNHVVPMMTELEPWDDIFYDEAERYLAK